MHRFGLGDDLDWSLVQKRCRGRLPHWEIPGMTAFITFRMADSLPASVIAKFRDRRRELSRRLELCPNDVELRKEVARLFTSEIDRFLDAGTGSCYLGRTKAAEKTMSALRHFDNDRYALHAAAVMPNHVHVVTTLAPDRQLESVYHSWKSYLSHEFSNMGDAPRPFWQEESYDHIVRNWRELFALTRYTLENPVKAKLADWPHVYDSGEIHSIRQSVEWA